MEAVQYKVVTDGSVVPMSDHDHKVLSEIKKILVEHGCEERFGVSLLTSDFNLKTNEDIIEFSDEETRTSTWHVVPSDAEVLSMDGVLKTNWHFDRTEETKAGTCRVVKCHYDNGHRRMHVWL